MYKILTQSQRQELLIQHRTERNKTVADRIKVVLWYDDNWTYEKISHALFLDKNTISNHLNEFLNDNKLTKNSGGSLSKLNLKQESKLIQLLEVNCFYNVKEIITLCQTTFGIMYQRTGMIDWLHRHGFNYSKPGLTLPNRSQTDQESFVKHYEKLKIKVDKSDGKEILLHMDSVHPTMTVKTSRCWIRKNNPVKLVVKASSTRVNLVGVLNLSAMSVLTATYNTINSENLILFLSDIVNFYGDKKIHIVLDNGRYHKTAEVISFCEKNNIKLHFLPAYSPNLNPIERVWKVMNKYVRNNVVFKNPKEFRGKINNFFNHTWEEISDNVKTEVNDNFHILI